ncbi:iron ABC transporter ATP-binding protein [Lactiplantibacillus plantarum]|nr:iron ABC transporter ATP-binding protein [Lactiplantibacillus plantarum]
MATLEVKDLHVEVTDDEQQKSREILKGVNLSMKTGEIHAIMGPNGTGKSTLSQTIMGQPAYHVTQGTSY